MSREQALGIWRSVRTTFVMFLVLVPIMLLADALGGSRSGRDWRELVLPAAGLLVFAGLLAEIGRRVINHLAGSAICRWRGVR